MPVREGVAAVFGALRARGTTPEQALRSDSQALDPHARHGSKRAKARGSASDGGQTLGRHGDGRPAHRPPARTPRRVVARRDPGRIFDSGWGVHPGGVHVGHARPIGGRPTRPFWQDDQGARGGGRVPHVVVARRVLAEQGGARQGRGGGARQPNFQGGVVVPARVVGHVGHLLGVGGRDSGDRGVSPGGPRALGGLRGARLRAVRDLARAVSHRLAHEARPAKVERAARGNVQRKRQWRILCGARRGQIQGCVALDLVHRARIRVVPRARGCGAAAGVDVARAAVWHAHPLGPRLRPLCRLVVVRRVPQPGRRDELRLVPGGHARDAGGRQRGLHPPREHLAGRGIAHPARVRGAGAGPRPAAAHGRGARVLHAALPDQRGRGADLRGRDRVCDVAHA